MDAFTVVGGSISIGTDALGYSFTTAGGFQGDGYIWFPSTGDPFQQISKPGLFQVAMSDVNYTNLDGSAGHDASFFGNVPFTGVGSFTSTFQFQSDYFCVAPCAGFGVTGSGFVTLNMVADPNMPGFFEVSSEKLVFDPPVSAPEPATMALMGIALALLLALRTRRWGTRGR